MGRLLLACVALAATAGPATARINDVEPPRHERQFRSELVRRVGPPATPSANGSVPWFLIAGGTSLLVGGAVVALIGGRSRG